ncbi:MAG: hypothetical protein ACP5H8_02055 [Candidatus Micrarchaeia archaeon]
MAEREETDWKPIIIIIFLVILGLLIVWLFSQQQGACPPESFQCTSSSCGCCVYDGFGNPIDYCDFATCGAGRFLNPQGQCCDINNPQSCILVQNVCTNPPSCDDTKPCCPGSVCENGTCKPCDKGMFCDPNNVNSCCTGYACNSLGRCESITSCSMKECKVPGEKCTVCDSQGSCMQCQDNSVCAYNPTQKKNVCAPQEGCPDGYVWMNGCCADVSTGQCISCTGDSCAPENVGQPCKKCDANNVCTICESSICAKDTVSGTYSCKLQGSCSDGLVECDDCATGCCNPDGTCADCIGNPCTAEQAGQPCSICDGNNCIVCGSSVCAKASKDSDEYKCIPGDAGLVQDNTCKFGYKDPITGECILNSIKVPYLCWKVIEISNKTFLVPCDNPDTPAQCNVYVNGAFVPCADKCVVYKPVLLQSKPIYLPTPCTGNDSTDTECYKFQNLNGFWVPIPCSAVNEECKKLVRLELGGNMVYLYIPCSMDSGKEVSPPEVCLDCQSVCKEDAVFYDLNGDGILDNEDVQLFDEAYNPGVYDMRLDFNGDGIVNEKDRECIAGACSGGGCRVVQPRQCTETENMGDIEKSLTAKALSSQNQYMYWCSPIKQNIKSYSLDKLFGGGIKEYASEIAKNMDDISGHNNLNSEEKHKTVFLQYVNQQFGNYALVYAFGNPFIQNSTLGNGDLYYSYCTYLVNPIDVNVERKSMQPIYYASRQGCSDRMKIYTDSSYLSFVENKAVSIYNNCMKNSSVCNEYYGFYPNMCKERAISLCNAELLDKNNSNRCISKCISANNGCTCKGQGCIGLDVTCVRDCTYKCLSTMDCTDWNKNQYLRECGYPNQPQNNPALKACESMNLPYSRYEDVLMTYSTNEPCTQFMQKYKQEGGWKELDYAVSSACTDQNMFCIASAMVFYDVMGSYMVGGWTLDTIPAGSISNVEYGGSRPDACGKLEDSFKKFGGDYVNLCYYQ